MKVIYALLVITILVIPSYGIGSEYNNILQINNDAPDASSNSAICEYNNSSFHGITSGNNANWYVIKFSSPSPINVTQMYIKRTYRCENIRIEWDGYILTNRTWSSDGGTILEGLNESESFFHIKLGPFNYTYDNLHRYTHENLTGGKSWRWNFTISHGTWYLICFVGETAECTQEVYFNTTNSDIEFLATTEGVGTHILLPEDFIGNLNIKRGYNMTGVLNGKKSIMVNNTFIGIHYSLFKWPCRGFERFRCTYPDGNTETFTLLSLANRKIVLSDFSQRLIIGKGGIWKFGLDLLMFPGKLPDGNYFAPGFGMGLVYADVKLP
ncbi:MAG: hypothetical protein U9O96_07940 [Candidatus Thermoplasmatota archaeon]|nr:hypothetical protein [Candidatus Thermoplasmatota archaeon]